MPRTTHTLHELALLALAGPITALTAAAQTGRFVVGDDRGEVALHEPRGRRTAGWRLPAPIVALASTPRGDRIASADASGQVLVADGSGQALLTTSLPGVTDLAIDPVTSTLYALDRAAGRVRRLDAAGEPLPEIPVPEGCCGLVCLPDGDGVVVCTQDGLVLRLAADGAQVWARDLARRGGGLAVDPSGAFLVLAGQGFGAEGLTLADGEVFRRFELGRAVGAVAAAPEAVLMGGSDGAVALVSRAGRGLGWNPLGSRVKQVALDREARHAAARLEDGTVRVLELITKEESRSRGGPRRAVRSDCGVRTLIDRRVFDDPVHAVAARVAIGSRGDRIAMIARRRRALLVDGSGEVLVERPLDGEALALSVSATGRLLLLTEGLLVVQEADGTPRLERAHRMMALRAAFASDLATAIVLDEVGTCRLIDLDVGSELAATPTEAADPPVTLMAVGEHGAFATRAGQVFVLQRRDRVLLVPPVQGDTTALAAVTRDGPIVTSGKHVCAFGWDGRPRWTRQSLGRVRATSAAPDGSLYCFGELETERVRARGTGIGRFDPVKGVPLALGLDASGAPAPATIDGRRISQFRADLTPSWQHTLPAEIRCAAAAPAAHRAALIAGERIFLLEAGPTGT